MRSTVLLPSLLLVFAASPVLAADIELAGELEMKSSPEALLAQWVKAHSGKDAFDQRDEQWWVEAVARVDGKRIQLFEAGSGDDKAIEHRRAFIKFLCEEANKGRVFLHHLEGGFASWSWEVINGRVVQAGTKGLEKMPVDSPAAVHYRETRAKQAQQLSARPPAEAFKELLARRAKSLRHTLLDGMDGATRKATAEALHGASGRRGPFMAIVAGTPFPTELPPEATVFVDHIETFDTWGQQGVLKAIRDNHAAIILGTDDAGAAKASGKLRADLYTRVARDLVDVRRLHP